MDFIWISGEIRRILGEIHGFHTDFMKSGRFQVKSGGFCMDFTPEIHRISGEITHEIHRISKGQLPGMVSPVFIIFTFSTTA